MAERPTLVDPPIEALLDKVGDSKFTLVAVSAIRAREINEYYNGLGSGHGALIPPQVTSCRTSRSRSPWRSSTRASSSSTARPPRSSRTSDCRPRPSEQARQDANSDLDAFTDALRDA